MLADAGPWGRVGSVQGEPSGFQAFTGGWEDGFCPELGWAVAGNVGT